MGNALLNCFRAIIPRRFRSPYYDPYSFSNDCWEQPEIIFRIANRVGINKKDNDCSFLLDNAQLSSSTSSLNSLSKLRELDPKYQGRNPRDYITVATVSCEKGRPKSSLAHVPNYFGVSSHRSSENNDRSELSKMMRRLWDRSSEVASHCKQQIIHPKKASPAVKRPNYSVAPITNKFPDRPEFDDASSLDLDWDHEPGVESIQTSFTNKPFVVGGSLSNNYHTEKRNATVSGGASGTVLTESALCEIGDEFASRGITGSASFQSTDIMLDSGIGGSSYAKAEKTTLGNESKPTARLERIGTTSNNDVRQAQEML